jgi:hypothetical protein
MVVLWILGIHLVELLIILFILLIRKNMKLEEVVISQQNQLNAYSILINKMDESFNKIDTKIWINEDAEIKATFDNMKEIQEMLSNVVE